MKFISGIVMVILGASPASADSCYLKNFGSFSKYFEVYDEATGTLVSSELIQPWEAISISVQGNRIAYRYRFKNDDPWSDTIGAWCNDDDVVNA